MPITNTGLIDGLYTEIKELGPRPLFAILNVAAHPSMAIVPTTVLFYTIIVLSCVQFIGQQKDESSQFYNTPTHAYNL